MCTPPFQQGGWASNQIFKKGVLDKTSTFRGGVAGKEVGEVFQVEGCNFHIKNKLKSEIFNDKKVYKQKKFCLKKIQTFKLGSFT